MLVAYELGLTLEQAVQMDPEEFTWWLAFLKYRAQLEEDANKSNRRGTRR